jgi:hypothetical protein
MVTRKARPAAVHVRGSALLLALVALVALPPLLCATPHHSSSPRLVRGLEEPPGKSLAVIPAVTRTVEPIAPPPQPARSSLVAFAEPVPHVVLDGSLDTRRGPPREFN